MSFDRETAGKAVVERAVDRMNPELRHQYSAVSKLLASATVSDVRARYRVGQIVAEIRGSSERYGARAVPLLAEALARDKSTLYHYAAVATAWSEAAIEGVLDRRMPGGEPLSWSHLIALAEIPSKEQREGLLKDVLLRGLSVRALSELARGRHVERARPSEAIPLPYARLRHLVAACQSIERFVVDDAFVEGVLTGASAEAAETVANALAAQARVIRHLEKNVARLKRAEAELRERSREVEPDAPRPSAKQVGDLPFPRLLVGAAP